MAAAKIGEKKALYYEAHAIVLETQKNYTEAQKILDKGVKM
jgi:hypothetical protein